MLYEWKVSSEHYMMAFFLKYYTTHLHFIILCSPTEIQRKISEQDKDVELNKAVFQIKRSLHSVHYRVQHVNMII